MTKFHKYRYLWRTFCYLLTYLLTYLLAYFFTY